MARAPGARALVLRKADPAGAVKERQPLGDPPAARARYLHREVAPGEVKVGHAEVRAGAHGSAGKRHGVGPRP